MNLAKLLNTSHYFKNQMYFYVQAIEQLETYHLQYHKKIKYLGLNLKKVEQEPHRENYTTSLRKSKYDLIKWGVYHVHGLEMFLLYQFYSN